MWRLLRERNGRSESSVRLERERIWDKKEAVALQWHLSFKLFLL